MLTAAWISYALLMAVALTAAVTDLRTGLVPNRLTYPAIFFGLVYWPLVGLVLADPQAALHLGRDAWIAMFCGLIPYALLVLTAGLGGGDMKLMAAIGALSASWQVVLSTTVYALLVAFVMALVVMVRRKVVKQTLARLFSAALLAPSRVRADPPRDSPKVAFAAAVAVGVAVAGAEQLLGWQSPWRGFSP